MSSSLALPSISLPDTPKAGTLADLLTSPPAPQQRTVDGGGKCVGCRVPLPAACLDVCPIERGERDAAMTLRATVMWLPEHWRPFVGHDLMGAVRSASADLWGPGQADEDARIALLVFAGHLRSNHGWLDSPQSWGYLTPTHMIAAALRAAADQNATLLT